MDLCARSRSVDQSSRCVPGAATLLISSRALLDAADLIERSITHVPVDDYAGWDVLRGMGGMSDEEADVAAREVVRATLLVVCEQLRDQADHDWERAVSSIGATVRSARRSPKRVPHRPARRTKPTRAKAPSPTVRPHADHPLRAA